MMINMCRNDWSRGRRVVGGVGGDLEGLNPLPCRRLVKCR